jgi:hypothetical protein
MLRCSAGVEVAACAGGWRGAGWPHGGRQRLNTRLQSNTRINTTHFSNTINQHEFEDCNMLCVHFSWSILTLGITTLDKS